MNEYTPEAWVIVEFSGSAVEGHRYHRILAGWYGGFASGDSWKISSGITKIVEHEQYWEIHNVSGSIYHCYKTTERFTGMTANIYESYRKENTDEVSINQIPIGSCLNYYQKNQ